MTPPPPRLLVIEDEHDIAALLDLHLSDMPADVTIAREGPTGPALARQGGFDAIVLKCTNLPPYADTLRAACGRPVHDIVTLLNARMAALAAA
jgi:DNA-binding response OmpR family regulator